MAISPETARVEALYQDMFDASDGSIESLRAAYSAMFAGFKVPADAVTDHFEAYGVPCLAVSAPGTRSDQVLMLVHGGGTCLGSADDYDEFGYRLSRAANCRVVVPDYRLAPEHPFPAALDDCVTVYRWITDQDHVHGVAVLGESAGGGIALSVTVRVRDEGVPQPDALVLVSPLIDLAAEGASMTERAHLDPLPIAIMIKRMGGAYLAGRDPKSHAAGLAAVCRPQRPAATTGAGGRARRPLRRRRAASREGASGRRRRGNGGRGGTAPHLPRVRFPARGAGSHRPHRQLLGRPILPATKSGTAMTALTPSTVAADSHSDVEALKRTFACFPLRCGRALHEPGRR